GHAAPRRRRDHPGRPHRRRRLLPAVDLESGALEGVRNPPPRGSRHHRGERRRGRGGVGGDRRHLARLQRRADPRPRQQQPAQRPVSLSGNRSLSTGEAAVSELARTWALRLLALGIAIGIWFNASVQDRLVSSEKVVEASVRYDRPRGFIIINPVQSVNVRLIGSKKAVRQLNPYMVDVQVELSRRQEG